MAPSVICNLLFTDNDDTDVFCKSYWCKVGPFCSTALLFELVKRLIIRIMVIYECLLGTYLPIDTIVT